MVVSAGPWPNEKSEMNPLEINEKLRPQQAENKRQFINTKEKYLVTQVAYFLAKGQNSYNYEECKDLLKSMLRDELQLKEEKLAEQLRQAEELRQYKVLVQSQERELRQLREKFQEGRDASRALNQHLQALLTLDEPATSQGRDLREQLAEGCRLAQHLVRKLTPENGEDEDEDVNIEETEKVQESRAPREVQKAEEKEEREDSLEEYSITCSNSHGPCESKQPHSNTKITFEEDQVNSRLIDSSSHDEWEDAVSIIPEEEKGAVSPGNAVESEEEEALQESWDEGYSTRSIPPDTSASYQSHSSTFHSLEEQQVDLALDVGSEYSIVKVIKPCQCHPRLSVRTWNSRQVWQTHTKPCSTCPGISSCELNVSCQLQIGALRCLISPGCFFSFISFSRLHGVLMEAGEPEVLQDSLNGCYWTPSSYFQLPDSFQHYTSGFYSLEEQHVSLALDLDNGFVTLTMIRFHLGFQMGVIFPH
uniref:Olduvai domain-containing protein n=1 Tax=Cercocebus atys TaxID=9531 RepID=A0A2K5N6L5_CERAT